MLRAYQVTSFRTLAPNKGVFFKHKKLFYFLQAPVILKAQALFSLVILRNIKPILKNHKFKLHSPVTESSFGRGTQTQN